MLYSTICQLVTKNNLCANKSTIIFERNAFVMNDPDSISERTSSFHFVFPKRPFESSCSTDSWKVRSSAESMTGKKETFAMKLKGKVAIVTASTAG